MSDMSTGDVLAALFVLLLIVGSVPAARWQIRRARLDDRRRDEIIRAAYPPRLTVWDENTSRWTTLQPGEHPGPGQLTDAQLIELDQLQLAWDMDAFDPALDPHWAAGRRRLTDAINDERQEGQL